MPILQPGAFQLPQTGVRWLDDLTGARPSTPPPNQPRTPQLSQASTYETYVQPAILGLRHAAEKVGEHLRKDPTQGMLGPDMGVAAEAVSHGLSGVLGHIVNLPKGGTFLHGGAQALENVETKLLNPRSTYGRALYTTPDRQIAEHFAQQQGGAVTPFTVAKEFPVWDARTPTLQDVEHFAPWLHPEDVAAARLDPTKLREVIPSAIQDNPQLLEQAGLGGVLGPYKLGGTEAAFTPAALDRGFITTPAGQPVTEAARARALEGLKRAAEVQR